MYDARHNATTMSESARNSLNIKGFFRASKIVCVGIVNKIVWIERLEFPKTLKINEFLITARKLH